MENKISVVTGTLNRKWLLSQVVDNTVFADDRIELVLVDGGSTDGTIDFIKGLEEPRIKLIEVGGRSSYPHFMNLGIRNASHELVAQWNDDVVMQNSWQDVFDEIDDSDFYVFSWAYADESGTRLGDHWNIVADKSNIVMNYGIYHKRVFRKVGMYDPKFKFYYADGDMSFRAREFGFKPKILGHINICSIQTNKLGKGSKDDRDAYNTNLQIYRNGGLPDGLEYL